MDKMKSVAIVDERKVELVETSMPEPGEKEILVKVKFSMLCTWEQRVFLRMMPFPLPYVGGHEFSGTIAAVGSSLKPGKYPIGTKVAPRVIPFCGECEYCRKGAQNMCNLVAHEASYGGLAEYITIPPEQLYMVSEDVPFERLAFAEPLACVLTCFDKIKVEMGDDVVVIGAGAMGLLIIMVAKRLGARVIVSEMDEERRKLAEKLGADWTVNPLEENAVGYVRKATHGKGAQVVINCVTAKTVVSECLAMLATTGSFVMFGKMFPDGKIEIDINEIHDRDLSIKGTMSCSVSAFQRSVRMLEQRLIEPEKWGLLSGSFCMNEAQKAFEMAVKPDTYRIGIRFE